MPAQHRGASESEVQCGPASLLTSFSGGEGVAGFPSLAARVLPLPSAATSCLSYLTTVSCLTYPYDVTLFDLLSVSGPHISCPVLDPLGHESQVPKLVCKHLV